MVESSFAGPRDSALIDVSNDEEVRWWAKELAVSGVTIIDAVAKVGRRADDVRRHLDQALAGGQSDG